MYDVYKKSLYITLLTVTYRRHMAPLQWRHNGDDGVSNHQLHHCLLNRGPVNSPHKWPAKRKMFPFDDVIMPWNFVITDSGMPCRLYGAKPSRNHWRLPLHRPSGNRMSLECRWSVVFPYTGVYTTTPLIPYGLGWHWSGIWVYRKYAN